MESECDIVGVGNAGVLLPKSTGCLRVEGASDLGDGACRCLTTGDPASRPEQVDVSTLDPLPHIHRGFTRSLWPSLPPRAGRDPVLLCPLPLKQEVLLLAESVP